MAFTGTRNGVERSARSRRDAGIAGQLARSTALWRLLSLALVAGLWEVAGQIPINWAFPPFSRVAVAFAEMVADGSLPLAYLDTIQPLALGVVISALLGVALGVAMGLRQDVAWAATPLFVVMQAAPMAALIPMITFIYGIGLTSKVLAVVVMAIPVIVLNAYKAVRNVNPSLIAMSRSFLGSRRQEVAKIVLPDASPMIFAGLRLGVASGFIGIVLAELLITPTGIGDLITYYRSVAKYPQMYATIASIIIFAALVISLLLRLETALFRPERRGSAA